jgi:DNA-binding transcriptional LysR family regulator
LAFRHIDSFDISVAQLDLNLVRLFVAIYENRSVSTAARTLNLTQPTVSYGLSKLRAVLQDQLFVRQRKG